jgi:hypothetical protein
VDVDAMAPRAEKAAREGSARARLKRITLPDLEELRKMT